MTSRDNVELAGTARRTNGYEANMQQGTYSVVVQRVAAAVIILSCVHMQDYDEDASEGNRSDYLSTVF